MAGFTESEVTTEVRKTQSFLTFSLPKLPEISPVKFRDDDYCTPSLSSTPPTCAKSRKLQFFDRWISPIAGGQAPRPSRFRLAMQQSHANGGPDRPKWRRSPMHFPTVSDWCHFRALVSSGIIIDALFRKYLKGFGKPSARSPAKKRKSCSGFGKSAGSALEGASKSPKPELGGIGITPAEAVHPCQDP